LSMWTTTSSILRRSDRPITFAELVGRESVITGTDCSLGRRAHLQIAWAKLHALRDSCSDREQEGVDLNSKVPVRNERKQAVSAPCRRLSPPQ
jgi:hypothetical protein